MTIACPTTALFSDISHHRLSVVLQGGVGKHNIVQVANHCRHWRDLFPDAEIILSISALDIVCGTSADGDTTGLMLHLPQGQADLAHSALEVIQATCNKVVQAHGALPLPSIKTDSPGPNNVNLQIAAAQTGLAVATGTHILRTRHDLIFADDSFIEQWLEGNRMPRGACNALQQRVLISYLYTLNPFTYERFPFHYSDWFHFGLAQDVRAIWNVPFMTMADAIHYKTHDCADHSNHQERRMLTRLAVEQHVAHTLFKNHFEGVGLDFHNDLQSAKISVDVLCDNFIICDLTDARCIFDKYAQDFENPRKRLHCISPDDWRLLVATAPMDREAILVERARIAADPALAPFPRHYPVSGLNTQIGEFAHGAIMAMERTGLLLHGPYDKLPQGSYTATIDLHRIEGKGIFSLRVTLDHGKVVLARREIALSDQRSGVIDIDFDIDQDGGNYIEVVLETPSVALIAVGNLTIAHRESLRAPGFSQLLSATDHPLCSNVGTRQGRTLRTTAAPGHLLYGPYISLERGHYTLTIDVVAPRAAGRSFIEILGGNGHKQVAFHVISQHDLDAGSITITFALARGTPNIEFRVNVDRLANFGLSDIRIFSGEHRVNRWALLKNSLVSRVRQIAWYLSLLR